MATFDRREEAFEQKFVHDEEMKFRAVARRNRKLGLWAARKMGLKDAEADAYALAVIDLDLTKPGSEEVFEKVRADLSRKGVSEPDHKIRHTMEDLLLEAIDELKG